MTPATHTLHDLGQTSPYLGLIIGELRDLSVQADRARFRRNLHKFGMLAGHEVSRHLGYVDQSVTTPLGTAMVPALPQQPVLATVLRAGLPLHDGLLELFDRADNAFVSAFRDPKPDGSFAIKVEYLASPPLAGRILVLSDPMLATGASMVLALETLLTRGVPAAIHVVSVLGTPAGIARVQAAYPQAHIWIGAIDPVLNSHAYIVPGLGDAGDLAFGGK